MGRVVGKELRGTEGKKTVIRIYHLRKNVTLNKNKKRKLIRLERE